MFRGMLYPYDTTCASVVSYGCDEYVVEVMISEEQLLTEPYQLTT